MNAVFHALAAVCRRLLGIGRRRADLSTNARIFTDIYRTNAWGHPESRSGPGSTLARGAAVIPAALPEVQPALVVVVTTTAQFDLVHGRLATQRARVQVMELHEPALVAGRGDWPESGAARGAWPRSG